MAIVDQFERVIIPEGKVTDDPPLNEYIAVRVIGSSSSSLKLVERSIKVTEFRGALTARGVDINRGLAFVISKVKLAETDN